VEPRQPAVALGQEEAVRKNKKKKAKKSKEEREII